MAGCLGDDGDPDPDGLEQSRPTEDTGSITGQVFDVDLNPLHNARVSLVDMNGTIVKNATSAVDGSYVMNDVLPGTYRISASAFCCEEKIDTIEVVANEEATKSFRLTQFSNDDLKIPYEVTDEHTAFIACQFTLPNNQSSGCGVVSGNVPRHAFGAGKGLRTLVGALKWEGGAGAAAAQDLDFTIRNAEGDVYAYTSGSSPLEVRIDNSDISGSATPFEEFDEDGMTLEFSARPTSGSIVYQQPLEYYWYLHYWQEGPEGVSALPDV